MDESKKWNVVSLFDTKTKGALRLARTDTRALADRYGMQVDVSAESGLVSVTPGRGMAPADDPFLNEEAYVDWPTAYRRAQCYATYVRRNKIAYVLEQRIADIRKAAVDNGSFRPGPEPANDSATGAPLPNQPPMLPLSAERQINEINQEILMPLRAMNIKNPGDQASVVAAIINLKLGATTESDQNWIKAPLLAKKAQS